MKITHVRISILESGPGYNNSSCTLEAQLDDDDDWDVVANDLRAMCKSQIKGQREIERLWETAATVRSQLNDYETARDRMRAEIEENRKIIREHEKLGEIARREGIDNSLCGELPF